MGTVSEEEEMLGVLNNLNTVDSRKSSDGGNFKKTQSRIRSASSSRPESAIARAKQKKEASLLSRIQIVDPDDHRLKRLHMFLSQENIELAKRILSKMENKKAKVKSKVGSSGTSKRDGGDSSTSE